METTTSIAEKIDDVLARIASIVESSGAERTIPTRLVAVTKTKPICDIIEAYNAGQRHFGENYIQELYEKSNDKFLQQHCPEIRWHFIGKCQSNKVKLLLNSSGLEYVETVGSVKLADKLNGQISRIAIDSCLDPKTIILKIFIQVNTSGESNKEGVEPGDASALVRHIVEQCPNLQFSGLMTIGSLSNSLQSTSTMLENLDFSCLIWTRKNVCQSLGILDEANLELSMGMSHDFEMAVRMGSTNVRIGSLIFGERTKKDAKVSPNDADVLSSKAS